MSGYWDEDQVRTREQDAIDALPTLHVAAARGVSPRELQARLGERIQTDRAGRSRIPRA